MSSRLAVPLAARPSSWQSHLQRSMHVSNTLCRAGIPSNRAAPSVASGRPQTEHALRLRRPTGCRMALLVAISRRLGQTTSISFLSCVDSRVVFGCRGACLGAGFLRRPPPPPPYPAAHTSAVDQRLWCVHTAILNRPPSVVRVSQICALACAHSSEGVLGSKRPIGGLRTGQACYLGRGRMVGRGWRGR